MIIVLDADGVLLDYNEQMAIFTQKVFNIRHPKIKHAYHYKNSHGLEFTPEELNRVIQRFDRDGWKTMPSLEGAVEATQKLHSGGHTLICLSSMPAKFASDRLENFKTLGVPIDKVVGVDRKADSPKAQYLNENSCDIFVDDQLRNFIDIPENICKVWIDHQFDACPNQGMDKKLAHHSYSSLLEFTQDFIAHPDKFKHC